VSSRQALCFVLSPLVAGSGLPQRLLPPILIVEFPVAASFDFHLKHMIADFQPVWSIVLPIDHGTRDLPQKLVLS
jgi:hypothetical protein